MITIPPEKVREKIRAQTGLTDADITAKIEEKLSSLAGLISRDGALHIIANELGVKTTPDREEVRVNNLLPGMKVQLNLRVMKPYELRTFSREGREGQVSSFLGGDETGVTRVTLWNEHAPLITSLPEGTIVQIKDALVKENQGRVEIHLNTQSTLSINPPGITVQASSGQASDRSFERKTIGQLTSSDEYVEILGTIVQMYDPRSFAKRSGEQGVVANALIDDGSGQIRAAFWDDDCKTLLGDAIDKPELLGDAKLELLGAVVRVAGRAKLNPTYNSMELSVSRFERNPSPESELNRLDKA